jgi:hypothetical protein
MVRDVTNWYLSMKECSVVAWLGLLKAGNETKRVSELSKASEEWLVLGLCEAGDATIVYYMHWNVSCLAQVNRLPCSN